MCVPQSEWNDGASICPPEGTGPTLYFQKVPEPKTVKNRLHLDLDIAFSSDPVPEGRHRGRGVGATVIGVTMTTYVRCGYSAERRWNERILGFCTTPARISMATRMVGSWSHAEGPSITVRR